MPLPRDPLVLAIDQGTTNTKAVVLDATGAVQARASVPVAIAFPRPGWVEQDPAALWAGVARVIDDCLGQIAPAQPVAIGISNQRETVLAWDRADGRPLGPAVVWQCRRTADFCQELRQRGLEPRLRERTGLTADPLFSASKARWLLQHVAESAEQVPRERVCLGTVDAWLLWNLTAGAVHATDVSNAARTQLLNLRTAAWDPEMLALFGVPAAALPTVRPSSGVVGTTAAIGRLAAGTPIAALVGDSHAALFGQRGFRPGAVKATYGTGSSLMTLLPGAPRVSERGLSTTVAWGTGEHVTYALEGNISVTGAAVEWFGQLLGASGGDATQTVAALAREARGDTGGVYVVPAFVGLGAPHWDEAARGLICGLTRGSTPAHVARAVVESIAYQIHDVFAAMAADVGAPPFVELLADGGATRNDELMQFQADLLGVPVARNASLDVSALGAAFLAGLGVGVWSGLDAIAALPRASDRFEPRMDPARRDGLLAGWREAVARAKHSASPASPR